MSLGSAVDVQVRTKALVAIGMTVIERGVKVEQTEIPLGFKSLEPVLYTQRFFLLPGEYSIAIDIDGARTIVPLRAVDMAEGRIAGEALEERPGEHRISLTPDPRSDDAREALARQSAIRAR